MQEIIEFIITLLKILPIAALIYLAKLLYEETKAKKLYKARFNRFVADYNRSRAASQNMEGRNQ